MINVLVQRVRAWSPFVKFMVPLIIFITVGETLLHGVKSAGVVLVAGIVIISILELVTTPVTTTLFLRLHGRSGVPMYCGGDERKTPTASDWHRAIMSMAACYALILAQFAFTSVTPFSFATLAGAAAMYLGVWLLILTGIPCLFDWLHFLGHRRHYRKEMAAVERERAVEQARTQALEVNQKFWGVVRDFREPGSEGVA